jgi:hypothetical protein
MCHNKSLLPGNREPRHEGNEQFPSLDTLQCIDIANDQCKFMLDDYVQKWKHTPAQFELNRKFARAHNPTDDNMEVGPVIYDNYKSQVNGYGETNIYKSDYGQLVPNPVATSKTDWRDGSAVRSVKTKKEASQQ